MKKTVGCVVLVVLMCFAIGLYVSRIPTTPDKTYEAYKEPVPLPGVRWPVARAEETFFGGPVFPEAVKEFFIEGAKGIPISKLVDLTIFGSFRPGLTFEQAVALYGQPTWVRTAREGRAAVYELPTARIEVEDMSYEASVPFTNYTRRTAYAYLKPFTKGCTPTAAIFDPSVNILIPAKGSIELHIEEGGVSEQAAFVLVSNGCVKAINWVWVKMTKEEKELMSEP